MFGGVSLPSSGNLPSGHLKTQTNNPRILALDELESSVPFAATSPTLSSILPTSPNFPTPSTPLPPRTRPPGTQYPHSPVSEISFPNTNPLGRSAQAIYLLDRVFTHIISPNQPSTD